MKLIATCRKCAGAFAIVLNGLAPVIGQPLDVQFDGYVKDLATRGSSIVNGDAFFLNTLRSRNQFSVGIGSHLSTEVWLDTELLAGSFLNSADYRASRNAVFDEFADLDWTIESTDDYRISQSLFRLTATASLGKTRAVVGRQRIAWGTGFVWTPTDVLNPVSPVAIERDEKAGVDAAYVEYGLGPMSRLEAAIAPSRNAERTSVAGRLSSHLGEFDVSAMGGRIRDAWVFGGDYAGYLGNAGFRGEAALTSGMGRNFVRAVVNTDYNFPGDYYTFVELHYNGAGAANRADYDFSQVLTGQTLNLGRYYAAASVSKNISPLVSGNFYGILNANDGSGLAGPAILWSAKENLELSASAYVFFGASNTEYGSVGNVYFLIAQYFF